MQDWRRDRIGACVRGENPMLLARMRSGFAVIGDTQVLPGYCVLLRYPKALTLNALSPAERTQFLLDMTMLGDAVLRACEPLRIQYDIQTEQEQYLLAHVRARYAWEPAAYLQKASAAHRMEPKHDPRYAYSEERYGELRHSIVTHLMQCFVEAGYTVEDPADCKKNG